MTDYTWPSDIIPVSGSFYPINKVAVHRSPLSGSVRTAQIHAPYWEGSFSFVNLTAAKAQELEATLWRIQGAVHRILVPMWDYQRQGAGGGTPRVNGGAQTGTSLITDGWPVSTLVLKAGDRIGVNSQALVIAEDATTNASGEVTLQLANEIHDYMQNNLLIETDRPVVRCILKNTFGLNTVPGRFKSGQIEFEEAIP